MPPEVTRTLGAAVRSLPEHCYHNPTWKGLAWMARDVLLYALCVAALLATDEPLLVVPLWVLTALAISALFILGHDAAHGALFRSRRLNHGLGRLAMLPALHLFEAWIYGHNRVHHGHTVRELFDYVWHPLSPDQYAALSPLARLGHRLKWSWLGGGIYYLHEIWWRRMIRFNAPARLRAGLRRDRILVGGWVLASSAALLWVGAAHYGTWSGAAWTWLKVVGVPFLLWNYSIGITVYVHHICENIAWHGRHEWTKFKGQVEGTTIIYIPRWLNFFYHNIFLHTPHHVDARIPFYGLPAAVKALRERYADVMVERRYRFADYWRTTRACKLFDFDTGRWRTYAEAGTEGR